MSDSDGENNFDIREKITLKQLNEDDLKNAEEERKLIEHMKKCKEALKESNKNNTNIDKEKTFNNLKLLFNSCINNLKELDNNLDNLIIEMEINIDNNEYNKVKKNIEDIKKLRILLKEYNNELNNNIYTKTTIIIADLLN